jgi:predicted ATPase/DNA-binding CsgD family transcriptional regulator
VPAGTPIQARLPVEPNSFIGRERELSELSRLVNSTRALTLCGPGGIGKSRLALRLLAMMEAEFPDGAWLVELGDLRHPDLVVSRVAAVVGVSEEPGRPLLETLAEALRPRRLLLALDTCEHLIGACARLSQALLAASPGLRLLITSREPLRIAAETIWRVPPLAMLSGGKGQDSGDWSRDEAVRLFADRAARYRPGFAVGPDNAAAVSSICLALDGLPLAIELAAARVRVLSVEQISAFLSNMFELLVGGDRSAPPRQRTLGAAIGWSYETLSPPERTVFRRLSVFAGWSLEMAEQICAGADIAAGEILGLITSLVDKSLVVLEPQVLGQARYRMLDTIREYAAARLAGGGDSARFQLALRDYVLRVAEDSLAIGMAQVSVPWSERVACSLRYDADASNVAQVLAWCLEHNDVEGGLRICVAVSPRWTVWGTFAEGGEWLDSFLAKDVSAVSPQVRGAAMIARAQLALSSDPAAAQTLARAGLELCREAGDRFWTAAALNLLTEAALQLSRADEAAAHADQALSIAHAAQDGWNEGYALGSKAVIAARAGRLREAHQLGSASVAVMRRIDQQWGAARALLGLGDLARLSGHPGEAHARYVEALPILEEIGARPEIARCLAGLGRVSLDLGATGQARGLLTRSIQLSQATGSRIGIVRGLEAFAALAVQENRPDQAVRLAAAAGTLRESAGLPPRRAAGTEAYLAPARRLGGSAVARLWAQGQALSSEAAIALALGLPRPSTADNGPVLTLMQTSQGPDAPPSPLTRREHQIAGLAASGRSNKAIAEELSISPTTVARHIANILAKLGFTSRTQIAAWFTSEPADAAQLGRPAGTT